MNQYGGAMHLPTCTHVCSEISSDTLVCVCQLANLRNIAIYFFLLKSPNSRPDLTGFSGKRCLSKSASFQKKSRTNVSLPDCPSKNLNMTDVVYNLRVFAFPLGEKFYFSWREKISQILHFGDVKFPPLIFLIFTAFILVPKYSSVSNVKQDGTAISELISFNLTI